LAIRVFTFKTRVFKFSKHILSSLAEDGWAGNHLLDWYWAGFIEMLGVICGRALNYFVATTEGSTVVQRVKGGCDRCGA
jgi:hypothetical protein